MTAIVGGLACQRDSFLKTLNTKVVSSVKYVPKEAKSTPKQTQYAVELSDTVLFPEGGGQPFDKGTIMLPGNKVIEVESVLRDQLSALHITNEHIEPGTEITVNVDWERRLDLMQQHTGQHLLSAVLDTYDLETISWSMNDMINYIELPKQVDQAIIDEVNEKVNQYIMRAIPIEVLTPEEKHHHSTNVPDDYDVSKGIIRVVKIGELDENPCCGTHLQNTQQIQAISLLHQTNVRGGHSRLHFICGSRVYKYLRKQHEILKQLGSELSSPMEDLVEKAEQLNVNYKKSQSRESNLLKELANIEAKRIFTNFTTKDKMVDFAYKPDNNAQYLTLLQKELLTLINSTKDNGVNLKDNQTVVFLCGDYASGNGGMVKVLGPQADTIQPELKQRITNLKGGGKGSSFQGKITKFEKGELESTLMYLESLCE
jgi:misacylated tRNA(Ala) deacylase